VVEANTELAAQPEIVNTDPYGGGWMIRVRFADPAQLDHLLDAAAYDALTAAG
jgi:glycine cleavage system H protein